MPAKFGYFWTITGDVQCVRRAGCSTGRWRMGCVGTRWGMTQMRQRGWSGAAIEVHLEVVVRVGK